jgi:hypothetical protein
MSAFTRKSKKFLRWLSKNQYKIYDGDIFNDFAAVFKNDLRISYPGNFFIKFPFTPFVLRFFEYCIPIQKYESLNAEGLSLSKLGITFVIVHDNISENMLNGNPNVLFIKIDRLKDRTDIFTNGKCSNKKFYFEDVLWKRSLEIKVDTKD